MITFLNCSPSMQGAKIQFDMRANCERIRRLFQRQDIECTVPRGATAEAGAYAYEMKFPASPMFMRRKPAHLWESRGVNES